MKLVLDMETRSRVPLKKQGMYIYSKDPSTDIMCIAAKADEQETVLWVPKKFRRLITWPEDILPVMDDFDFIHLVHSADEVHAHNAGFERLMWQWVMWRTYGYMNLDFNKWRCTAAKAAAYALPRDLDGACKALGLPVSKDPVGYKVMLRMCQPNRVGQWNEDVNDFYKLCLYCMQDVEAEKHLDDALHDLTPEEQELWLLDQEINDRGFYVDMEAIINIAHKVQSKEDKLLREIKTLTGGQINSTRQRDATLAWLKQNGTDLDNLQKNTVVEALEGGNLSEAAERLLTIRRSLAKASVAKFDAMRRLADQDDHRVRGAFLFHGANTGRWAGKGVQPHNYPRDSFPEEEIDTLLRWGVDKVDERYGCAIRMASKCLRGMIVATPGKKLLCGDFKAIEARGLAWIAGEEHILEAFRSGKDLYKVTAGDIYGLQYDEISKESPERQVGKVADLALGYQGWVGAFRQMAAGYNVDYPQDQREVLVERIIQLRDPDKKADPVTEEEIFAQWAAPICGRWRETHPATVEFWHGINDAAFCAVRDKSVYSYGRIKFGIRDKFLHCRLPSGRLLSYYDPKIEEVITKFGQKKLCVSYMGVNSMTKRWQRIYTYGGKLTENIVQAISRDMLAEAMKRLDKAGYSIVMHVHDEIVADEDDHKTIEEFNQIITVIPSWAAGWPVGASGWQGKRYRK